MINSVVVDTKYLYHYHDFHKEILAAIEPHHVVLDIGKSLRASHDSITAKQVDTLDINDFGDYPNIIGDLCEEDLPADMHGRYDVIACLAILEHVYDPFKAVENLKKMLKPGGKLFGYVPYLYRYHAPLDLHFQDYFRFSKDALSFLLKDFARVRLYPVRGLISSALLILIGGFWKRHIEKTGIHYYLDRLAGDKNNIKQCSGFHFIAER
jgi:SAM-dependent methyltransferase